MLPFLQTASPACPGARLSLPELQVPSAKLPSPEAQAEHAPAGLQLANQERRAFQIQVSQPREMSHSNPARTKTVKQTLQVMQD